ncbi:hypothetical protein [Paenibacillus sp. FSL K6-2859]|uniref:hypothetical protein n=1 Tax=Paenibacillus sp. FSL K6-2859 TaxID=2921482 RepID=UPI0030F50935
MKIVRQQNDFLVISCTRCSQQHVIEYPGFNKTTQGYQLVKTVTCRCGNISNAAKWEKVISSRTKDRLADAYIMIKGTIGIIFFIVVVIFVFKGCSAMIEPNNEKKNFNDITEKEYNDFMKWDAKEQQKKRDESPAFGK